MLILRYFLVLSRSLHEPPSKRETNTFISQMKGILWELVFGQSPKIELKTTEASKSLDPPRKVLVKLQTLKWFPNYLLFRTLGSSSSGLRADLCAEKETTPTG